MEAVLDWCEAVYRRALRAPEGKHEKTQNILSVGGELNMEPVEYGEPTMSHTNPLYILTPHFLKKSILILSPYKGLILPTDLLSSYFPNIIPHMFIICFLGPSLDLFKMTIQREKIGTRKQNSTGLTSVITTSTVQA